MAMIPRTGGGLQQNPQRGIRFGANADGTLKDFNAAKIQKVGDGQFRYGNQGRVFDARGPQAAQKLFQDRYDRRAARIPTAQPPAQSPAPQPTPAPAPGPTGAAKPNAGSQIDPSAFFPGTGTYDPKSFQNDAIYKFNMDQGNKELDRRLAAMGLSGSGASIEAANDLTAKVNADAAQRWTNTMTNNADRLYNMTRDESDRLMRRDENAFNNRFKILDLMMSQNPMQYSMGGLNTYGDLNMGRAKDRKNFLANDYARQIAGGGGGMPPRPPGQPFTGDIDLLGSIYNNNSSNSMWDMLSKGLGTFANYL